MTSPRSTIRSNQSSRTGRFAIGAAASAALVATFGFAAPAAAEETTEEPSSAELLEKIEELQKQVEQLQETQEETSEQLSAAEVDAAVSRVLDDAEARSELLSMQGFTAGHDGKGFVLKDDSGDNKLNLGFQFQFRWVSNLMDGEDGDFGTGSFDSDEFVSDEGFQMRRVRLKAKGNVISPKLKYNLNYALEANDLLDFDVKYELNDNLTLQFGQYKTPLHFEEINSSSRFVAVERSLINEVLGGGFTDRIQGFSLIHSQDNLKAQVVVHDGLNTDNTGPFRAGGPRGFSDSPQFGVSGRVDFVAIGDGFGPAKDFSTIAGNGSDGDYLHIGAGADFSDYGSEYSIVHTIDALYKSGEGANNFSIFAAFYGVATETIDTATGNESDGYNAGIEGQFVYAFTDKLDGFVRASCIELDDEEWLGDDSFYEFTVGGSYYFKKHNAKVSIDATYLPDGAPFGSGGTGFAGGDEDQIVVRGQFQLLI